MEKTVSLEVAKELKELGWKKETLFVWDRAHESSSTFDDYNDENNNFVTSFFDSSGYKIACAPQLHEILDVLPGDLEEEVGAYYLKMDKSQKDYMVSYDDLSCDTSLGNSEWNKNPHDAAAQLLIWCVKNNYVTL